MKGTGYRKFVLGILQAHQSVRPPTLRRSTDHERHRLSVGGRKNGFGDSNIEGTRLHFEYYLDVFISVEGVNGDMQAAWEGYVIVSHECVGEIGTLL